MSTAIHIDHVSKQYRLGEVGTGTLSHDLNRWWHRLRGKPDPYLKVGAENDRTQQGGDYVWALRDISFDVEQGEVVGIIGRNGAGKSTLLKILSKVTSPTTGSIRMKGRLASLLEVGTGFHPEMTGRENIYMNGTIMGMTRHEIKARFDEIVEFAGVAKYVDTPVKRYSSGMTVRLGFAIAAHLEPEILVVDEVLAVGDAEFQKKAIGKMKDVSQGEGRTVLFVSHNMASVKSLCNKGIVLNQGAVHFIGDVTQAVHQYSTKFGGNKPILRKAKYDHLHFCIDSLEIQNSRNTDFFDEFDEISIKSLITIKSDLQVHLTFVLYGESGDPLFTFSHTREFQKLAVGQNNILCTMPKGFLNVGEYSLSVYLIQNKKETLFVEHGIIVFSIQPGERPIGAWMGKEPGFIKPQFNWQLT